MKNRLLQYFWVALGCLICGASINLFLVPHHLLSGGVSGLAIISYFLFGFPIGLQILIMNIPLIYAAYKFLGRDYTITTIFGTIMFSAAVDATQFLTKFNLLDEPILAALTGGLVSGLGSGIIFRVNGSGGGLDIIAAIVKKYYSLNFGAVGFSINFIIMLLSAALFGLKLAVLTLIAMFVGANITDKVVEGFNRRKTIHIVSYKTQEIVEAILKEVGRGVTILQGEGAYTRQRKQVIFVVVSLTQIAKIKLLVQEADPSAFMIVSDAAEVMGRGFTLPGSKDL
ncbi:YitT family protein [Dendrosporobacter sp. 1207_IL3150]|uniref:YitT family protein n=1 Tax=Dendrosporobacter sp. 1207_IL3150 TaxID=3084054 RepID=UPI002FDB2694